MPCDLSSDNSYISVYVIVKDKFVQVFQPFYSHSHSDICIYVDTFLGTKFIYFEKFLSTGLQCVWCQLKSCINILKYHVFK